MKIEKQANALDWSRIAGDLDTHGCATTGVLLAPETCAELTKSYDDEARFRSKIVMARHGFGQGEYKYFGIAAAGDRCGVAVQLLSAARRDREPLE